MTAPKPATDDLLDAIVEAHAHGLLTDHVHTHGPSETGCGPECADGCDYCAPRHAELSALLARIEQLEAQRLRWAKWLSEDASHSETCSSQHIGKKQCDCGFLGLAAEADAVLAVEKRCDGDAAALKELGL